jgi:hypothetical protein
MSARKSLLLEDLRQLESKSSFYKAFRAFKTLKASLSIRQKAPQIVYNDQSLSFFTNFSLKAKELLIFS